MALKYYVSFGTFVIPFKTAMHIKALRNFLEEKKKLLFVSLNTSCPEQLPIKTALKILSPYLQM